MRKMAVFVEGPTEMTFLRRLLTEVAGKNHINFTIHEACGNREDRYLAEYRYEAKWDAKWYVAIIISNSDDNVTSDINDRYEGLIEQGYESIVAVRDAGPKIPRHEIIDHLNGFKDNVKSHNVTPALIFAIMEIEAWFLAEHTHFQKIHPELTLDRIKSALFFDPGVDDVELRDHPSLDMKKLYSLYGKQYDKSEICRKNTINILDIESIYIDLPKRVPSLARLISVINQFFSSPSS